MMNLKFNSSNVELKVTHAVKQSDVIVIPTFTDARSLQATIDTVNLVKVANKLIAIIINNFTRETKFNYAKDGSEWFSKVHQINGEYQLNKTRIAHEKIYDAIVALGVN